MRMDERRGGTFARLVTMAYLDGDQGCSAEKVLPAVGQVCPLSFSLRLLPPRRKKHRNIQSRVMFKPT